MSEMGVFRKVVFGESFSILLYESFAIDNLRHNNRTGSLFFGNFGGCHACISWIFSKIE